MINLIAETEEKTLPDMFDMEWSHVTTLPPVGAVSEDRRVLYLCDNSAFETDGTSEKQQVID